MVILAIIVPLLLLASASSLGGLLLRLISPPRHCDAPFAAVSLGLGVLMLVLFPAGLAGLLCPCLAWVVMVIPTILFAPYLLTVARQFLSLLRRLLAAEGIFNKLLLFSLIASFAIGLVSSLAPPTETDALTVHLLVPQTYARAQRMLPMPDNWDSAMAMGPHLLSTLMLLASPGDSAPAVLHFLAGWLFILWVWRFTRRRFGKSAAYASASVLAAAPMITHLIVAPMVDMYFALFALASFVCLLCYLDTGVGKAFVLASLFAGLSAGAKYSGLVVVLAVVLSGGVYSLYRKRFAPALSLVALSAIVALVLASPWYVRNYLWTHNPVFPTMKTVFGGQGWDAPSWETAPPGDLRSAVLRRSPLNMLLAPWRMTVDVETVSGGISEAIGPAFLIFLPLVLLMRSRKRLFLKSALYCLLSFLLIYWTSPRPRTRYYLPLIPVTSAYVGAGLLFLKRCRRPALWVGRAVVLLTAAGGLAVAALYGIPFAKAVFHLTPRDTFLSRSTDFYDEYLWMRANLPPDARLAVQATNDLYYCPRPSYRLGTSSDYTHCDSRAFFRLDDDSTPSLALRRLRELGVTHLFVGAGFISESSASSAGRLLARLEEDGSLVRIRAALSTRGTRNPFSSQRQEAVALYELSGAGEAQ